MPQFRKKPVVVDAIWAQDLFKAWQNGDLPHSHEYFWREAMENGVVHLFPNATAEPVCLAYVEVQTLEGLVRGMPNDWIIRGVKGEFYVCKPDIFEATYEKL